jgi:hypothetical protein
MGRIKQDKIFDNKFNEKGFEYDPTINFMPSDKSDVDLEDQVHYDILFNDIDKIIKESKKFKHLIKLDINDKVIKLTKVQMNEIYIYVINNLNMTYRKMEIFDILTDYFCVFPAKFYNALSNTFKDELMSELDDANNIFKTKKLNRLF